MISTDLNISLASWALDIEKQRASVSAFNIANININGVKRTANFDALINNMSRAVSASNSVEMKYYFDTRVVIEKSDVSVGSTPVALDDEVFTLSLAEGKFKAISEALSKKYGLMNLAMRGK